MPLIAHFPDSVVPVVGGEADPGQKVDQIPSPGTEKKRISLEKVPQMCPISHLKKSLQDSRGTA